MAAARRIWPVLLAGGTGSRLWPMSRGLFPKQFMALASDATLLQETARRLAAPPFGAPIVLVNDEHRFIAAEQLRAAGIAPEALVLEPVGRNTAPAAAVAAMMVARREADGIMLLAPADHVIADAAAFLAGVETALPAAEAGYLVTFGVVPDRAETGYGYIESDPAGQVGPGVSAVRSFTEKPDPGTAKSYVESGSHCWNSGIFLMKAGVYLEELQRHAPGVLAAAGGALEGAVPDLDFLRLDKAALEKAPAISIDYAVMEKTARAAVVKVDMGWSDVGSWAALWEIAARDEAGNVVRGDAVLRRVAGSYVRSERPLVAVLGLDDVIVVATDDAVLVAARDSAQDVKGLVETLNGDGRPEPVTHTTVFRPWGSFQTVDAGDRFQVKRITVKPGGRLSLQTHAHRAEHWVVVAGTATVTRGADEFELAENQSVYIPAGTAHRLENRTEAPLHLIEVQSGGYLGEDDIVRLEDVYGRK